MNSYGSSKISFCNFVTPLFGEPFFDEGGSSFETIVQPKLTIHPKFAHFAARSILINAICFKPGFLIRTEPVNDSHWGRLPW